jgi:peptide/nickel transport system permease protein
MIPTLLGITIVVFTIMAAAPGGITAQSLVGGSDMKPQEKQALMDYYNKRYGLDQPAYMQYLRWLNNISPVGFKLDDKNNFGEFTFSKGSDLGESLYYGRPVADILSERIPITLLLNVLSIPLIYILAITIGMKAATDRDGRFDVSSSVIMLGLWSVPTMLAGVLLIGFFANIQHWQWFPTAGLSSYTAKNMPFLPHWSSIWDIAKVFLYSALGAILAISLSRLNHFQIRITLFALLGIVLGLWMANAHPLSLTLNWVFWPLLLGSTLAVLAWTDFKLFRIAGLGFIGAGIGLLLAMNSLEAGFVRGYLLDNFWHLTLPILCLSYGGFAALAKLTRTAVLENLNSDYARTARAKGVPEKEVLWHHVFRNSLLPLITASAGLLPALMAGSLIVEQIFSIEGMGQLAIEAVKSRDRELVLSITYVSGFLTLIGYLLADFLYTLVDPRVSYE